LTQEIVDTQKSQDNLDPDETELETIFKRTAEEIYKDLRNAILDDVLDGKSDDEELEIACILGENIKLFLLLFLIIVVKIMKTPTLNLKRVMMKAILKRVMMKAILKRLMMKAIKLSKPKKRKKKLKIRA
jgi:hypothetical protein